MPSIQDCATLAYDVYSRSGNTAAMGAGWTRLDGQNWTYGFAAGRYEKAGDVIIAFRGTDMDDWRDVLTDAAMVPILQPGSARRTVRVLLHQYDVDNPNLVSSLAPHLAELLAQCPPVASYIREEANRAPSEQVQLALSYFDSCRPRPRFVTGHSLGGALAQVISQQRSVPAVVFNSPCIGLLRGTVPQSSQTILQIITVGDPASLATTTAGSLPHGRVMPITIPRFTRPPRLQISPPTVLDRVAPVPARVYRETEAEVRYYMELLTYLGNVMMYYHGMEPLMRALHGDARYSVALRDDLTNA